MTGTGKFTYAAMLICLLLSACSGIKHLPPGEKLYTGAKIIIEASDETGRKKQRVVKAVAKDALRPVPNKSFFGMRPKLWRYMAAGDHPNTKFEKWLRKKGEAPVLLSNVQPGVTASIIDANLFNIGIFKGHTDFKTVEKKHTGRILYNSYIHRPFTVDSLFFAIHNDSVSHIVLAAKDKSVIEPGDDYNLDLLKKERVRIDALLKNKGYFYFNPDYLLFKVDTSAINHTVTLKLALKDSIPENALVVYRINHVFIDPGYSIRKEVADSIEQTFKYRDFVFRGIEADMNIKPGVILRSVYLKKNEKYSRLNHTITLNRLMTMGNFKFVQVKFSDSDTNVTGFLDVDILMTTMANRAFRVEMDIVSKSNNFAGPRVNISLLNRNTFRGAELLNFNLAGSYEAQLSNKEENLYSFSLNPQVELTFPILLVPFNIRKKNSIYIPKTQFSLSYNYLKRVNYFNMETFLFGYGYRWKDNVRGEHELNPVNLSFTSLGDQSADFVALLDANPYLKKSYEEQFIAGGNYSYTYNEQVLPMKKMQYFFHGSAEIAGNTFSLAKLIIGEKPSSGDHLTIAGSVYSQYSKLSIDTRGFYNFPDRNKMALRFFAGMAKSYGNSSVLPYTKQFFSGGPNSIRAFQINSVGPDTVYQDSDNNGFLQMGGDIKLEMNAEYRFTIVRFFKGALFADAGNVWLLKSNPANVASPFLLSGFINEVAVGAGVGLRIDVSFFLLRFDLAMPVRKPWLEEKQRWVFNQINFGSHPWRRNNLVLNVAIGYPF